MIQGYLLLIYCTFLEYVVSIKVSQTPLQITVKAGDSVEMMCSWETSQILSRIQVEWNKNNVSHVISEKTFLNTTVIEVVNRITLKIVNTSATLQISNTERNDVGKYYCILISEIPLLKKGVGNGTQLDITEDVAKSNTETKETVKVTQTPLYIDAVEGVSVEMMCSWETTEEPGEVVVVKFSKNNIADSIISQINNGKEVLNKFTLIKNKQHATFHISNIKKDDEGKYYCQAEIRIPKHSNGSGNGTVVNVTEVSTKTQNSTSWVASNVLRSLPLFAMIAAVLYVNQRKKGAELRKLCWKPSTTDTDFEDSEIEHG